MFAQYLFNDRVTSQWYSLLIDFTITSLQYEFADGLSGGVAEGDVGLDSS